MPFTPSPIIVKDANDTNQAMIAYSDGTNKAFARPLTDDSGNLISPATAGLQTTANSTLATIATNTTSLATAAAQTTGNTSLATVATNTGTVNTNLGAQADTVASTDTGAFSLIALVKRGLQNGTNILAKLPTLVSGRIPVDGSGVTQPVSAASLPLPSGAATAANQSTANTSLGTIATNTTGAATAANQSSANTKLDSILESCRPRIVAAGSTLTRPADTTAYVSGDLLANNTTAGSVTPLTIAAARGNDVAGQVVRGRLKKSSTGTNGIFRIHLFNVSPTVANGDNGAFAPAAMAGWLGALDVSTNQVFGDGSAGIAIPALGSSVPFVTASGTPNLFALIEVRAGYTPTSAEVFTLELEVM
ncbi:hypothetical protein J8F10_08910 [Gemmata sp. G18]|uniref:Tail fiber protein n=1 Tax=Gemmata palustris TaxID=2822762 RepID=A0ABS5BNZ9_9BACT|nr:hypothetical protein [Gemmata palustris]MBP3955399.1 hypothetical protein [Gemmata palustris]